MIPNDREADVTTLAFRTLLAEVDAAITTAGALWKNHNTRKLHDDYIHQHEVIRGLYAIRRVIVMQAAAVGVELVAR